MNINKYKNIKSKIDLIKDMVGEGQHDIFENLIIGLIDEINRPTIEKIWNNDTPIISYWIILINGINNIYEVSLAKKILFWKEFFNNSTSEVRCLQSSNQDMFNLCIKQFRVNSYPSIICSNTPSFKDIIVINTKLIDRLQKDEFGIQTLLNQIHNGLIRGKSLNQIHNEVYSDEFWKLFEKVSQLKEMIARDEVEKVIRILSKSQYIKDKQIENEIITISSNIHNSKSNYRQGLISKEDLSLFRTSSLNRLLHIIDEINVKN